LLNKVVAIEASPQTKSLVSCLTRPTGLRGCSKLKPFADVRQRGELACCAPQLDLNVRRFGQNCDHVLFKRGDHAREPRHQK
jgi:hypothetical protein